MKKLLFILAFSVPALGQNWSTFIDTSRAYDWTSGVGFAIPSYSVNCSTQPTLTAGSGAAGANATAIQNALNSCDSTHNVVNIAAGTYYVSGITYPSHGKQVIRGAGPNSTKLISTSEASCEGYGGGLCMIDSAPVYSGSTEVQYNTGTQQCKWTGGLTQGSTSLTLSSCGGTPPNGRLIILDQIVDQTDNSGVYICNETTPYSCNYDGTGGSFGRPTRNQTQTVMVTGVSSLGGGSYTVTISPGVLFTNIQSGRNPGAWWAGGTTTLNGLENLTVDGNAVGNTLNMYDCYQCWAKNVTLLNGGRASAVAMQSANVVIRDSYFYGSQSASPVSYNVESQISSFGLVENNIMEQTTLPGMMNSGTGWVYGYNFGIGSKGFAAGFVGAAFSSHSGGNEMNLWEGNNFQGIQADDAWGSTAQQTYFRNLLTGWKPSVVGASTPIIHRSYVRAMNVVGNVLGQPSFHTRYQTIALSSSTWDGGNEDVSIYDLGLGHNGSVICGAGTPTTAPYCDPIAVSSLMRWGNYDVVNAAVKWDSTEASPASMLYVNSNFSSGYFNSLAHTLPASLYYNSTPSWWPGGKNWPPIGPDVSTGNVGTCTGTYSGSQATLNAQCTGGSNTTAWASHVTSIPAQDCFLSLGGKPDGSGSALAFDAATCYSVTSSHTWTATVVGSGTLSGTNSGSGTYTDGTTIGPITANPGTGYSFTGWSAVSGNALCSGATNPCPSFVINSNSAATATFTVNTYAITTTTTGAGSGTITGCAGGHNYATSYTCTVTPSAGSTLTSVTGCGGSGTTTYTGSMPASNCTVTATFALGSYTLSTTTTGAGTGTITGCAGAHNYTAAYSCTVTPTGGSTLVSVSGCGGSGTTTYAGTMPSSNCTVTATFNPPITPGAPTGLTGIIINGVSVH